MRMTAVRHMMVLCFALSACCVTTSPPESAAREAPRWQYSTTEHPQGVVLVAHGLNLRPSAMDDLCSALNARGFHTYRLSLAGHTESRDDIFPAAQWTADFSQAYETVHARYPHVPLSIVGFSAGGLVATRFLDSTPNLEVKPQRMVLLAPALSLRFLPRTAYLLRLLPPLGIRTPNVAPPRYRRFSATPLFWYRNTIDLYDETRTLEHPETLQMIPTLVLMSAEDELISRPILKTWIDENHLDQTWEIEEVDPLSQDPDLYEHLIIDEESMGIQSWHKLVESIAAFLSTTEAI